MPKGTIQGNASDPDQSLARILEIDVLRGVALVGIIIIHHIEHFHVFRTPDHTPEWLSDFDPKVMSAVFFMISGKAYALFSLLFGMSFWIQIKRRHLRGQRYVWRHVWRMALLFGFGMFHEVFFSGDILHMYAVFGVFLLAVRRLPPAWLLALSLVLISLPLHVASLADAAITGSGFNFRVQEENWLADIHQITMSPSFWDDVRFNFVVLDDILVWNWNVGRVLLVPGLFLAGVYVAKAKLLDRPARWWVGVLYIAATVSLAFWAIKNHVLPMIEFNESDRYVATVFFETHHRTAFMIVYASGVVLAWKVGLWRRALGILAPFGRLGLTNYILSSVLGGFIYFGWGLGLHEYLGSTLTFFVGCASLAAQIALSHLWLRFFDQGPLEALWRYLTWLREPRR